MLKFPAFYQLKSLQVIGSLVQFSVHPLEYFFFFVQNTVIFAGLFMLEINSIEFAWEKSLSIVNNIQGADWTPIRQRPMTWKSFNLGRLRVGG